MSPSKSVPVYAKFLTSLLLFLTLLACKEDAPVIHRSADQIEIVFLNKWLVNQDNFDKPEYKEKFDVYFNEGLVSKNYAQSSDALLAVFQVMVYRGLGYDRYYYEVLKNYVQKHEQDIFIDHLFSFYIYLGSYETLNSDFQLAIETLKKLSKFEPYNYTTFTDMGYAYYYISLNYYYQGDYIKSLEEINTASFYFNQTDNYSGQALVESRKAFVNFATKNTEDAVNSIDKALSIYDKVLDPYGKASAMLDKHDYLSDINLVKANLYLDTINTYMAKNHISYPAVLLKYNHLKIKKYITENNIDSLDRLMPLFEKQVNEINSKEWKNILESAAGWYHLSKYKKLNNQAELASLLKVYKENDDYLLSVDVLLLLKNDAINANNLPKVIEYDRELEKIESKLKQEELQLNVKVFEKKIDAEKKAKIIAQQKNQLIKSNNFIMGLAILVLAIIITFWIIWLRRKRNHAVDEQLKQEQFTFQLLQNTEEERSRIANELHDSVNQDLLTMKHNVLNGNQVLADDFTKVIQEVRNISRNLHPSILENLGIKASIEHLCEKLTDVGLFTTCEIEYADQLSKNKELQIYRIIQEALNNTLKHGKAKASKVILIAKNNFLHLEIKDNGNGFDVDKQLKSPKSFGLQSIMQRAKAIAAKININSNHKGTIILIKIPF